MTERKSDALRFHEAVRGRSAKGRVVSAGIPTGASEPNPIQRLTVAGIAAALDVPRSSAQNWPKRPDFPRPVVTSKPLRWDREEVLAWAEEHVHLPGFASSRHYGARHEASRNPASRNPASRNPRGVPGGLHPTQWPTAAPMSSWQIGKALNFASSSSSYTHRAGFPSPIEGSDPPRWLSDDVLAWALENKHRKALRNWVMGTWFDNLSRNRVTRNEVDLFRGGLLVGLPTASFRWYAYQDPAFPEELRPGVWARDEVLRWAEVDALPQVRARLKISNIEDRY